MNRLKDFDFMQLNLYSFLNDLTTHARETINIFNRFLAEEARARLFELRDKLDVRFARNSYFQALLCCFLFSHRNMKRISNYRQIR